MVESESPFMESSLKYPNFFVFSNSCFLSMYHISKWLPFLYSFVFIKIIPHCLVLKSKIQKIILP